METSSKDAISWLHGLTDYFEFKNNTEIAAVCDNFLKVLYSKNKAHTLRNSMIEALPKESDEASIFNVLNFFSHAANSEDEMYLDEISSALALMYPDESIFKIINKYFRETNDPLSIQDAFSRGQVQSKIWLTEELQKVSKHFNTIFHLGGWYGQLTWYFDNKITFDKYRNFDMDIEACKISDYIINLRHLENYKVKSVEIGLPLWSDSDDKKNMNWISRTGCEYEIKNYSNDNTFKEKTQPNLIINTSAEHMPSIWFDKFVNRPQETDPLFVIQTNNLFEVPEHVNCVHSVDHLIKKFNMTRIEYAGELQLKGYKRFMIIGRP
jgi:hypothetical protein